MRIKILAILFGLFFSLSLFAADYYCPMHCEGKKIYSAPGNCPVCGMHLELKAEDESLVHPLNTSEFRVDFSVSPNPPVATAPAQLSLSAHTTKDGAVVSSLEGPFQLVVVPQNLGSFERIPLSAERDGKFGASYRFPCAGNFLAYASFTPKGARTQIFPIAIQASGASACIGSAPTKAKAEWSQGVYSAKIISQKWTARKSVELKFKFLKNGKPTDLELVDGEKGRMTLISSDTVHYVKAHPFLQDGKGPNTFKGEFSFFAVFPKGGLYKAWVEVQHQGKILVSEFLLKVTD